VVARDTAAPLASVRAATSSRGWGASLLDRSTWIVALTTVLLVPLIVTASTYNSYRLPKEMFVRGAGIAIAALALIRWLLFGWSPRWRPDHKWFFVALVVGWSIVTALTASNRVLALESIAWIGGCAILFLALDAGLPGRWWSLIYTVLCAAAFNALYCMLSVLGWAGERGLYEGRAHGFLGNPDDQGSYLSFAAVGAVALCLATPRRRALHMALAALIVAALFATQTIGAVAAFFASMFVLTMIAAGRRAIPVGVILVVVGGLVVVTYQPLQSRIKRWLVASRSGHIDDILSNRGAGILAGWEMFKEHPVVGVGPANYRYEFYDYKLRVEEQHRTLMLASTRAGQFGDAHNDHVQTLAQTGLPGYALLIAASIIVAARSFRRGEAGVEGRFARLASLPLVTAFLVSAMPQFPMELAGPMTALIAVLVPCVMQHGKTA